MKIKLTKKHAETLTDFIGVQKFNDTVEVIEKGQLYTKEETGDYEWIDNGLYVFYSDMENALYEPTEEIEFEIDEETRKAIYLYSSSLTMTAIRDILSSKRLSNDEVYDLDEDEIWEANDSLYEQIEEDYPIIDEDGEVYEYAKWKFEEIDVIEPNEVFSKLINKELMEGDEIIISSEVFTYQYGKIQNAYGVDLTVEKLYHAEKVEFRRMVYVNFDQAMNSGKRIKYNHEYAHTDDFYDLGDILQLLINNNPDDVVREVLSSKCWIIE